MSDVILNRVRKLLKLAESPNVNEAASAAAMAQRLIDEHKLSTAMLAYDEPTTAEPDEPIVDFGNAGAPLDSFYSQRWQGSLAVYVCSANGCKPYRSGKTLHIIGRPSDAETARYIYAYLRQQVERLAEVNGRGFGITWRNNFRVGVVETIGRRLQEARANMAESARHKAEAEVNAGNALALVRVNTALATIEQKRTSVDAWAKVNMKLGRGSSGGRTSYDGSARAAGRRAGESVDLGGGNRRALGSGQRALNAGR